MALLPLLTLASPAEAGTASIAFPAISVAGDGETIILSTTLAPGETIPAVRVHPPSQTGGCTSVNTDPGETIPELQQFEGTTVGISGGGTWQPEDVGTYAFCVYFSNGTSVEIDRRVDPPLIFTLGVTPGKAGSPANVALNGVLSASLGQSIGIELKLRTAGGLPCSSSPFTEPGTPVTDDAPGRYFNYWFVQAIDPNRDIAIHADTAPLASGTYLLCMWEAPINVERADLTNITLATSTTFVVDPLESTSAPLGTTAPPATTRSLPRNLAAPSLTGKLRVGSILHCSTGRWSRPPTISAYRWYRGARRIARATSATYRVTKADSRQRLRCQVVITFDSRHSTSKLSASHAVVHVSP